MDEPKAKTGWSDRRDFAELTTPAASSLRSSQPPLLSEEGNNAVRYFRVTHYRIQGRILIGPLLKLDFKLINRYFPIALMPA